MYDENINDVVQRRTKNLISFLKKIKNIRFLKIQTVVWDEDFKFNVPGSKSKYNVLVNFLTEDGQIKRAYILARFNNPPMELAGLG